MENLDKIKEIIHELDTKTKSNLIDVAKNREDVVLVDVSNLLYKAAWVNQGLSIFDMGREVPTGHFFGFLRSICSMKRKLNAPAIILCVDGYDRDRQEASGGTYKDNRDSKRFNIHAEVPKILEMVSLMKGIYVAHDPSKEADDMIYSISNVLDYLFTKNGVNKNIYVYSEDKDLYQCITDRVKVIRKFGDKGLSGKNLDMWDKAKVLETYGVDPKYLGTFKAMVNDDSDNIKGYFRMPKKIAAKLSVAGEFHEDKMTVCEDIYGKFTATDLKWFKVINEDYSRFQTNIKLTKAKLFSFVLGVPVSNRAWDLVNYYQLEDYKKGVANYGSK